MATNKEIVEGVDASFASGDVPAVLGAMDQNIRWAEGDTVVALGNYSWKHKSSGAAAEVKMVHVWTVADGTLTTFQQHVDTVRVRELS
jgi:hypothetical protein